MTGQKNWSDLSDWSSALGDSWSLPDSLAVCPLWALSMLAFALVARGLRPTMRMSPAGRAACLHVGGEIIHAAMVDGYCLLVTESGTVLGFAADGEITDDLADDLADVVGVPSPRDPGRQIENSPIGDGDFSAA
jgi:hypothetical protein